MDNITKRKARVDAKAKSATIAGKPKKAARLNEKAAKLAGKELEQAYKATMKKGGTPRKKK